MSKKEESWTHEIRAHLVALSREPERPALDIEWLIARCDDTLVRYEGHWQQASYRQLTKDVANFADEFPGMLPQELVCAPE
ncbi:hypothetical protein [Polyangium jinanense]|uniref:Uncharacterized protein n=1 Tax=Polyangium jinanense TaxID=2829994 RepID=A0A9X4AUE6_9BACT|nr:hypothetical protein [Polyangium jinanense]MDC3960699.1 hypothetical protein [Polyangium jinanense]MDC3984531.1 hypothetical protein [Polyangium jinanense]